MPTETVAPTIHKVQGMTLDLAAMDISKSFEHGQAYVALTRCHTPEGLQLLGDRKGAREALMKAIKCCPVVDVVVCCLFILYSLLLEYDISGGRVR
jgi:hypothetical protein